MKYKNFLMMFFISIFLTTSAVADEWESMDSGTEQDLHSVFMLNVATGWATGGLGIGFAGTSEPTILKTLDGGDSWEPQTLPDELLGSDIIYSVCFSGVEDGWAVGSGGTILKTDDSGDSWVLQDVLDYPGTLMDVWCFDENTAVIVGDSSVDSILRTSNGGLTWPSVLADDVSMNTVFFVDDVGYAGGTNGEFYRSEDGGASWELRSTILYEDEEVGGKILHDIYCSDEETCWVAGSNEIVHLTEDGGSSWEDYSNGGAVSGLRAIEFINTTDGFVGGQNVIRYTGDSGLEWNVSMADISYASGNLPFNMVRGIDCDGDVCWAVGDEGHILRYGEPLFAIWEPPVTEIPLDEPEEEQPSHCVPFFDDCEAGWYPVPIYDSAGCIVDYVCVKEEDYQKMEISEEDMDQFSSYLPEVPGIGENERMNAFIDDEVIGIIIVEGKVNLVSGKEIDKTSLSVYLSEETLDMIVDSEDPMQAALDAIDSGDIVIKGDSFSGKVKVFFLKIAMVFI